MQDLHSTTGHQEPDWSGSGAAAAAALPQRFAVLLLCHVEVAVVLMQAPVQGMQQRRSHTATAFSTAWLCGPWHSLEPCGTGPPLNTSLESSDKLESNRQARLAGSADVAPVLLAQHLGAGGCHLPDGRTPPMLPCTTGPCHRPLLRQLQGPFIIERVGISKSKVTCLKLRVTSQVLTSHLEQAS